MEYQHRHEPRPYQRDIFEKTRDLPGWLFLLEQGTGKSKLTIDTFAWGFLNRKVNGLVVTAPGDVPLNWGTEAYNEIKKEPFGEIRKHMPANLVEKTAIHVYDAQKAGTKRAMADLERVRTHQGPAALCISYDALITERGYAAVDNFLRTRPCLWAPDEARRIKEWTATRTKDSIKLAPLAKIRRPLSGTLMSNGPFEAFFPVYFADPTFWASHGFPGSTAYKQFSGFKTYFGEWSIGYAAGGRKFPKLVKYRHMDELKRMLAEISSRVLKEDVLMDLPPKLYMNRMFRLTSEQRKDYDILDSELDEILSAGDEVSDGVKITNAMTKILRMKEITAGYIRNDGVVLHRYPKNPRLDAFMDTVEDAVEQGIVWCQFVPEVDDVAAALGNRCVKYYGPNKDERARSKSAFLAGDVQWIVATEPSMKEGHTYVNAKREEYYTTGPDYDARAQSEDRAHREGQHDVVTITDYIAEDTIDVENVACHINKEDLKSYLCSDKRRSRRRPLVETMLEVQAIGPAGINFDCVG